MTRGTLSGPLGGPLQFDGSLNIKDMSKSTCRGCGRQFQNLGIHLGRSKTCWAVYRHEEPPSVEIDELEPEPEQEQPSNEAEHHYRSVVRHEVFSDVADLYWNENITDMQMDKIRAAVSRWIDVGLHELTTEVTEKYGETGACTLAFVKERLKPFVGLQTEKQVKSYAESVLSMPSMIENKFGDGQQSSFNIFVVDWLVLLMKEDAKVRAQMVAKSEYWKSGACSKAPVVIDHLDKGSAFRSTSFAKPDQDLPGKPRKLKVALQLGYDDVQGTKNALSPHALKQLLSGFYVSIVNLDTPFRFEHRNMCPIMMCKESVLKAFDPVRVLSGAAALPTSLPAAFPTAFPAAHPA